MVLIPRPLPRYRFFKDPLSLVRCMKPTHPSKDDFDAFREAVRRVGRTSLLKTDKYHHEEADSDWHSFLNSVHSEQPLLTRYEESWPTEYFYNYLKARRKGKTSKKEMEVPEPNQIIARPGGKMLFFRFLADLEQVMKNTHPNRASFEKFKNQVQSESRKIEAKYRSEQDDAVWSDFTQSMIAIDSSLQRYEDVWPLEYYFNSLARSRIREARLKPTRLRARMRSGARDVVFPTQATLSNGSSQATSSRAILNGREGSAAQQTVVLAPCFHCHRSPITDPSFARKLAVFLEHDQALIMELARLGVALDQHLEFLLTLPPTFLERTIVAIPTVQLKPTSKCRLLDLFKRHQISQPTATRSDIITSFVLRQTPCSVHEPVSVAEMTLPLRGELHILGIAELIPAFAQMKIVDETMFARFKQLDDKLRMLLVKKYQLHLSDFHFFMIGISCGSKPVREIGWIDFDF